MKQSYLFLSLILFLNNAYSQNLIEIENFGENPGNLKMFIHHNTVKDSIKPPLVIVLHGCSQNVKNVSELTGWNKLADLNNFVVLYPQQKILNNPSLCFNWFRNNDIEKNKGECESIYEMISFAKKQYNIDSNRIYITGLSAGGFMSVAMIATHPELFQSAAIFAGGAYKIATNPFAAIQAMSSKDAIDQKKLIHNIREQNPNYIGQFPSLLIYQGLNDKIVNPKNAISLVNQWAGINNIDSISDKIEHSYMGINDITRTTYNDSLGKPKILLYEVANLGHQLMIKPGNKDDEGGNMRNFAVNKGYHSTYQTAKEFGILLKSNLSNK
jgi:poly(hydroxyalkanoate) depolymerase family esterase